MTVTDVMVEAACVKYLDLMVEATGNEDETVAPEFMRAAIEAALAAQPVPTDAEIEGAIERYGDADVCYKECSDDINYGDGAWESSVAASRGNRDAARANLLRLIAAQRAVARREALESGLKAAQGAFGLLSECAFATEVSVTGDGETMHAYYVPLGIITAMSEAFGTDRWVPFLIEHGFVASEEEYAMLAKEAE